MRWINFAVGVARVATAVLPFAAALYVVHYPLTELEFQQFTVFMSLWFMDILLWQKK